MRPSAIARGDMPGPKHYIGWWGDMGGPPQKGIYSYSQSPFRQSPFRGVLKGYIFNGYKRIASNAPYFVVPVIIGYAVIQWGNKESSYIHSKKAHLDALARGEAPQH
ncbi:hypothetical protein M422DRAFT_213398 [Sphaerobolus stellatus SS14]|uniref:Cytochrome b-c1 complex subunit 8 n=1 Tax=Sphaerobolus stellatus (strain SS14) TaxID=990650 RepID=A0A0C9V8A2_SPHS4|nr:hypothetical protein M422DRAFT_213398 [Sphaerobolus stellatus SS14]